MACIEDRVDSVIQRASEEIRCSKPVEMIFSSFGFRSPIMREKFAKIIPQNRTLKDKTCLIIPFAGFDIEKTFELEKQGLVDFGFNEKKILSVHDHSFTTCFFVPDYIYVPGGDPFKLLSEIKKRTLRSEIRHRVLTYKTVYIGVSAGAYVASPNIEYVKQLEDDNYGENEYNALGLVTSLIICHADHYSFSQIQYCEEISQTKPILVKDDQVVYFKNDKWSYVE